MKHLLFYFAIGFLFTTTLKAQGCSDAGICSAGNRFKSTIESTKNALEIGAIYGIGEADVTYFSPYLSYTRTLNNHLSLSSKFTYSNANGSFGSKSAFGDAYLLANYTWNQKNNKQWSSIVGLKIPFNSSNLKINDQPLPMEYQSSLGTLDAILGLNYTLNKWDFNGALQIPLVNFNKNSYFKEYSDSVDFSSTNLFDRKADALFRATYTISTTKQKFSFKPNVLFLYHLGEDSYENIYGKRQNIMGSDGLTINGNIITTYNLNNKSSLELSLATPFVVREVRPDGLTRKFTAGLMYKMSF